MDLQFESMLAGLDSGQMKIYARGCNNCHLVFQNGNKVLVILFRKYLWGKKTGDQHLCRNVGSAFLEDINMIYVG